MIADTADGFRAGGGAIGDGSDFGSVAPGTRSETLLRVVRRWWWLGLLVLAGVTVASWLVGGWVSDQARQEAAQAAGIPLDRVEMRDGLNVHLTGFATEAERDRAVAAVSALDSSWAVTGGLTPGLAGAEVASAPSAPAAASAAPASVVPSATVPPTTATTTVPSKAAASATGAGGDGSSSLAKALNDLLQRSPIEFAAGSARLPTSATAVLDQAAATIAGAPAAVRVAVVGHTDADGSVAANQRLSERRAQAVVDHLVARGGIARSRLEVEGRGEREPVVTPERSDVDKQRNRRIEWVQQ